MNIDMLNNKLVIKFFHVVIITVVIFCFLSCKEKEKKTLLLFSQKESVICDQRFVLDSIIIIETKTTMLMRQYSGRGGYLESKYIKTNNSFSELREGFHGNIEEGKSIDKSIQIDTLPVFSINDTFFTYKSKRKYYPTTIDLSLGDAQYKVAKQGNTYVSSRHSMIDSLYNEYYYYNKNFDIYKYIAKFRGNICVYRNAR
jgi:hypothetical protein